MKSISVKQTLHKLFLLISAIIVLHSVVSILIINGTFHYWNLHYYTLLSNILLSLVFITLAFLSQASKIRSHLSFMVLICVSITGIVYNFILVPTGYGNPVTENWANFVTHFLSMVLAFANYLIFEEKGILSFKHSLMAIAPPFMYWVIFMFIGMYPYPFMNPLMIGWVMVFVWFIIIVLVIVGLALLLVFLDKRPKLLAASSIFLTITILIAGIFLSPYRQVVQWSQLMENALEVEEINIGFNVSRARTYTMDTAFILSEGIITTFLIIDENDNVLFYVVGEEENIIGVEIDLSRGRYSATWVFFTDYDDVVNYLTKMELESIIPNYSDYIYDVFNRDEINYESYISIWLR